MTDYRASDFLTQHIQSILDFYAPAVWDKAGGLHQNFLDDGTVFDPDTRHLVSTTRMVFNYAKAYQLTGDEQYKDLARHAFDHLSNVHFDASREAWVWVLRGGEPVDQTNYCYGLAFVILAHASALEIGLEGARAGLDLAFEVMEKRFWQPEQGLYADEASADWSTLSAYRGQNANMHSCEALIAAFEVTGNVAFLDRAILLAKQFVISLADKAGGLVWEHFTDTLDVDWSYNKDDPANLYRPWGFQPGHQTEWTKLLLTLYEHRAESWMVSRAKSLFDRAVEAAWDTQKGGLFYGFDPDGQICDSDKYFWVQAETIAASARLAVATGDVQYWNWYDRLWAWCDTHMIDHTHGAWFRVLDADNRKYSDQKSVSGGKCDYHTMGACHDILRTLKRGGLA